MKKLILDRVEGFLTKQECNDIIEACKHSFPASRGLINFLDRESKLVQDGKLELLASAINKKILDLIQRRFPEESLKLSWHSIRKYSPKGVRYKEQHRDYGRYTLTCLLSDPDDFEGCEFWIKLDGSSCSIHKQKNHILESRKQGEIICFRGAKSDEGGQYHGTTRITFGERFIMAWFFVKDTKRKRK